MAVLVGVGTIHITMPLWRLVCLSPSFSFQQPTCFVASLISVPCPPWLGPLKVPLGVLLPLTLGVLSSVSPFGPSHD